MGTFPISEQGSVRTLRLLTRVSSCLAILLAASLAHARPWAEHAGHLAMLAKQIETNENEIRALIEHKKHTEEPKEIAEIMHSIGEHHTALEKATLAYDQERQHVRFEHPEKNDQLERVYVRHDLKSVEDLEHDSDRGLDGRLDHIRARVFATYPLPERKPVEGMKKYEFRKPASLENEEDADEKIHLVK